MKMVESHALFFRRERFPRSSMPATAATSPATSAAHADLAWRVVGLLSLYRLLVPVVLVCALWLSGQRLTLVPRPELFISVCVVYFTAAVLLIIARRLRWEPW